MNVQKSGMANSVQPPLIYFSGFPPHFKVPKRRVAIADVTTKNPKPPNVSRPSIPTVAPIKQEIRNLVLFSLVLCKTLGG